jgi:hypothetical protein
LKAGASPERSRPLYPFGGKAGRHPPKRPLALAIGGKSARDRNPRPRSRATRFTQPRGVAEKQLSRREGVDSHDCAPADVPRAAQSTKSDRRAPTPAAIHEAGRFVEDLPRRSLKRTPAGCRRQVSRDNVTTGAPRNMPQRPAQGPTDENAQ